jgi:hypothetical protein
MIIVPLIPFRRRRKPGGATQAPPAALVLVAASYDEIEGLLLLTFDRAVSVDGFVGGAAIVVRDGAFNLTAYQAAADGASVEAPDQVLIVLTPTGAASGGDVEMTATAASGIVAVDDGGTWAGVTGLLLPFP